MKIWADITCYMRSEPQPRTPRSWEAVFAWLRVVVTRSPDYPPDVWVLNAHGIGIGDCRLSSREVTAAKREALSVVRQKLEQALAAMPLRSKIRGAAK